MRVPRVAAAFVLTAGAVILGASTAAAAPVFSAVDEQYVGNYGSQQGCNAEGANLPAHPSWTHYVCRPKPDGTYDLYLTNEG
ncbi:hypothetical protein KO481_17335 [Nocardia sp. NEAU-G5]|uniref:Secreted protein n=1 Tax=Nocardia albiluteola TaxID=2842303 RepID=A0ABS6B0I6_9NOCA|nr:hypothetical protein [Nocardia albiluteola]MBU3063285.1 hypothetical protein [Nocardia albiluteola]